MGDGHPITAILYKMCKKVVLCTNEIGTESEHQQIFDTAIVKVKHWGRSSFKTSGS